MARPANAVARVEAGVATAYCVVESSLYTLEMQPGYPGHRTKSFSTAMNAALSKDCTAYGGLGGGVMEGGGAMQGMLCPTIMVDSNG